MQKRRLFAYVDWYLIAAALSVSLLGLSTMRSFSAENAFFEKQTIWIAIAFAVFLVSSQLDYGFLRRTQILSALYASVIALLVLVLFFGALVKGAQNRFNLGLLS